jgi:hypothetical protein
MASYPGYMGPMGMRSPIFGTPQAPQNLLGLGPQIAPSDMRKKRGIQMAGDTLTQLGIGLMGQGPSSTPQNPLQGLAQGLQGANAMASQRGQEAQDERRMQMAEGQFGMQQAEFGLKQQQAQYEQARQAKLEELITTLPPDMQSAARADPDSFWKAYAESKFPKEKEPWKPKIETIRRGNQDESGYIDQQGQWVPMSSGAAFAPRSENEEFGLQPFITKDSDGTLHAWQLSKSGPPKEIPLPDGQSVTQQITMFDAGTQGVPVGKLTGPQPAGIAAIPKDIAGEASAKTQGTAQGEAVAALPAYASSAQIALDSVDQLLSPESLKGREQASGLSSWFDPRNYVAGQPGYDFKANLDKLRGGVFLTAFQQLKGGGAITEVEGKKAEQAIAAMDAAQSETQFKTALEEYRKVIQRGIEVAKQRATASPVMPGGALPQDATDAAARKQKYGLE